MTKRYVAVVLPLLLAAGVALGATDGTWIYDGNGNWSDGTKWLNGLVANGPDQTAYFTTAISDRRDVTLDADRTIGYLQFSNPGGAPQVQWPLLSSGPALTLATTAGVPTITANTAAGVFAPISGNQGFQKLGSGELGLSDNGVYTGVTTVSEGGIRIGANALGATGSGNHTVVADGAYVEAWTATNEDFIITGSGRGDGALLAGQTDSVAFGGHLTLNGDAVIGAWGEVSGPLLTGDVSLPGSALLTFRSTASEGWAVHGTIGGTGGLVAAYNGAELYAANTFRGDTVVNGRLGIMNNNAVQNSTVQMNQSHLRFDLTVLAPNFGGLAGPADLDLSQDSLARTLTVGGNGADTTYSGNLQGDGSSLTKTGVGTLTLTGDNTYDGGTMITGGILVAGHDHALGTGLVNIDDGTLRIAPGFTISNSLSISGAGSTLGGSGTYLGNVSMGAGSILAPGSSPGLLTIDGDYTQDPLASLDMQLGGTVRGDQYDALVVTGTMTLAGTLDVSLWNGFDPVAGNSFDLLEWDTLHGTLNFVNLSGLSAGLSWDTSSLYTTGTLSVHSNAHPVPALGALLLAVFGAGVVGGLRKRL
jgi:autotransporter-associated beta strand protein